MSKCTSNKGKLPRYHYVSCHRSSYILTNIEYCFKDAGTKEYREILNRSFQVYSFVEIEQRTCLFFVVGDKVLLNDETVRRGRSSKLS